MYAVHETLTIYELYWIKQKEEQTASEKCREQGRHHSYI